jgi:hypothetical protein
MSSHDNTTLPLASDYEDEEEISDKAYVFWVPMYSETSLIQPPWDQEKLALLER